MQSGRRGGWKGVGSPSLGSQGAEPPTKIFETDLLQISFLCAYDEFCDFLDLESIMHPTMSVNGVR